MASSIRFLALFSILASFSIMACKEKNCNDASNPECPNYDSCLRYKDFSADFTMKEILVVDRNRKWEVETDTCLTVNMVKFSPKSTGLDSVKWLIGAQVLTDTVVLRRGFPAHSHTPITLIAYFRSHAGCTAHPGGVDTVTKFLYAEFNPWDAPINGVYEGSNTDAPDDLFTIQVSDTTTNLNFLGGAPPVNVTPFPRTGAIQQLPKGTPDNDMYGNRYYAFGGKHFFYDEEAAAGGPVEDARSNFFMRSYGTLKNGILTVRYTYDGNGHSNFLYGTQHVERSDVSKIFVGRKIRWY